MKRASPASVLIAADPGLPTSAAHAIRDDLARALEEDHGTPADIEVITEMIRFEQDGTMTTPEAQSHREEAYDSTVLVILAELPRHDGDALVTVEACPEFNRVLVSYPTFGIMRVRRRMVRELAPMIAGLLDDHPEAHSNSSRSWWMTGRTMLGMIATNEPWATLPKLSGALAAAAATGAFGVFYSSIWQMAEALSLPRLTLISLTAMIVMTVWLILANGLWDRPRNESLKSVIGLYNGSTLITVALCVIGLYTALFLLILATGLAVIDPGFMTQALGIDSGFQHYVRIAWLAASMGVVAGALGAGFDSGTDLRRITHGARERQRWYAE